MSSLFGRLLGFRNNRILPLPYPSTPGAHTPTNVPGQSLARLQRRVSRTRSGTSTDIHDSADEPVGGESGLSRSTVASESLVSQHSSENSSDLQALQQQVLSTAGRHSPHPEVSEHKSYPAAPEEGILHATCFGKPNHKAEQKKALKTPPRLPQDLSKMSRDKQINYAKELSLGVANRIFELDVHWKDAFLYTKGQSKSRLQKWMTRESSPQVMAFKANILEIVRSVISKLNTFELLHYPKHQEELSDQEVRQIIKMAIYIHKVNLAQSADASLHASERMPKPEELLPGFLRGQCKIVELPRDITYERYNSVEGEYHPYVVPVGTMSTERHALSMHERHLMEERSELGLANHAHGIYGYTAPGKIVKSIGLHETVQEDVEGRGARAVLTPQTSRKLSQMPSEVTEQFFLSTTQRGLALEKVLKLELESKNLELLDNWKVFLRQMTAFEKSTGIFKSLAKEIELQAARNTNKKVTEEEICHIIDSKESEFAKSLGKVHLTDVDKIAILVNFEAVLLVKQIPSYAPYVASAFSLAGDILHLVPVIGYGSLAFAGTSMIMEYFLSKQQHIEVHDPKGLPEIRQRIEFQQLRREQDSLWQQLRNHMPHHEERWWRELKAVGPQRMILEGIKFVPVVGTAATALSIFAECLVIRDKYHERHKAQEKAKQGAASTIYNATVFQMYAKELASPETEA